MNRVLNIIGFFAIWVVVILVIALLSMQSRERQLRELVSSIDIEIVDSTEHNNLVSRRMVEEMLKESRIEIVGRAIADVPLNQIERVIESNGFVAGAEAYINYAGALKIEVKQRSAILRLRLDGYNCYITHDGFVFGAPTTAALYTNVVTGDYRPLFKPGYVGYIEECREQLIAELELEIERVEREKYPILLRERENADDQRAVRKRYINRSAFESKDQFAKRVADLREENRILRERYAYRQRVIDSELKVLEQRQERYRDQQKKIEKKCDDIYNLITFVEMLEDDDFWRSEVVQIDLKEQQRGVSGVRASIAVRSAKFIVTIGELNGDRDELEAKFERLRGFYDKALTRVGWDRYREINLEFKNQVVCRR